MIHRRGLITGLGSLFIAAPAIVRASSLDMLRGVPLQPFAMRAIDIPDGGTLTLYYIERNILYGIIPFRHMIDISSGEKLP